MEEPIGADLIRPPVTVRDFFAGQAMSAYVVASAGRWSEKQVADAAGILADAMVSERERSADKLQTRSKASG